MVVYYNDGESMMKFFDGEDGITVDLPDEGKTGTFTSVKELCYAIAPILAIPESPEVEKESKKSKKS